MIYYYTGDRKPPWPIVALGMIGAVLSGVTFLHIPGKVGNNYFYYLQFVFGNVFGYIFIKDIMIQIYYDLKTRMISIWDL